MQFGLDPDEEGENSRVVDLAFREVQCCVVLLAGGVLKSQELMFGHTFLVLFFSFQAVHAFLTVPVPRQDTGSPWQDVEATVEPSHLLMLQYAVARGHLRRVVERLVDVQGVEVWQRGSTNSTRNKVLNLFATTLKRCVVNDPNPNTQQWIDRLARLSRKQLVRLPIEMWLPLEKTANAATDLFLSPEVIQSIVERT